MLEHPFHSYRIQFLCYGDGGFRVQKECHKEVERCDGGDGGDKLRHLKIDFHRLSQHHLYTSSQNG